MHRRPLMIDEFTLQLLTSTQSPGNEFLPVFSGHACRLTFHFLLLISGFIACELHKQKSPPVAADPGLLTDVLSPPPR